MKKNLCVFLSALFLFAFSSITRGQIITTFAGTGTAGSSGDNGPASVATLSLPSGIAVDVSGNVYVGGFGTGVVRKVDIFNIISRYAGNGTFGYTGDGGAATAAQLISAMGIASDAAGNIYFADEQNSSIRKVTTSGVISTVAGNGTGGYSGDNTAATAAQLSSPINVAVDGAGNLFIADYGNNVVRKVDAAGVITTIAGIGIGGYSADGIPATASLLNGPIGVAADQSGNIYIADAGNNRIRKIDVSGIITTVAGVGTPGYSGDGAAATAAQLTAPTGIIADKYGKLFIADKNNNVVREVNAAGIISTIAGTGVAGYAGDGASALIAQLNNPRNLAMDRQGNLYIADYANNVVRFLLLNHAPIFIGGLAQAISVCQDAPATSINSLFAVNDIDAGQTETWTVTSGPFNGTLSGFPATATSTGGSVAPTGLTYTPNPGFSGSDIFTVSVDDGNGGTASTTINVTINPTPTMDPVANQSACNNATTTAVNFTSLMSGVTYSWTNSNTSIGVGPNGTSNIAPFVATNPGSATSTATIIVTPSANSCAGVPQSFTFSVYPTPDVASLPNQTVCNGSLTTPVIFSGGVTGTTYSWTDGPFSIGLPGAGSGNIGAFAASNGTTASQTNTFVVTPSANGCTGSSGSFLITVNPTPDVVPPINQAVCNGDITSVVTFFGSVAGTTYNWVNSDPSIGLAASGSGDIAPFIGTNVISTTVVATINVTPVANSCTGPTQSFTITVYPTPMLGPVMAPASICDSTTLYYILTSPTPGTTFTWRRPVVAGISNPVGHGVDTINEVLINTTSAPVTVIYQDTLRANGCFNAQNVILTVNPRPSLSSPAGPFAQCDSTLFKYDPASNVSGATFMWTRNYVLGIDRLGATGAGIVRDTLVNQTSNNIDVPYKYVTTANGCTDTQQIVVTIHPTPRLSSSDTEARCSGATFVYAPVGTVTGSAFTWTRASVTGITTASSSGTGTINEAVFSNTTTPVNAIYVYSITANGCTHKQNVVLTVNPAPAIPSIDNNPPASVCYGTMDQSFGTSIVPAAGVSYVWTASNATIFATGTNKQYAIINFPNPGAAIITLTAKAIGGCTSNTTFTVNVGTSAADAPARVTYFNGQFVCLQNIEKGYQWGYDDASLKSTVLTGEINQNYYNTAPDLTHNHYWVIVDDNGCKQKSYYNAPLSVTPNVEVVSVKVYPNPANDKVNVTISSTLQDATQVEVYNMLGQVVRTAITENNATEIDVQALPSGIYILNCIRGDVKIATARFIKN